MKLTKTTTAALSKKAAKIGLIGAGLLGGARILRPILFDKLDKYSKEKLTDRDKAQVDKLVKDFQDKNGKDNIFKDPDFPNSHAFRNPLTVRNKNTGEIKPMKQWWDSISEDKKKELRDKAEKDKKNRNFNLKHTLDFLDKDVNCNNPRIVLGKYQGPAPIAHEIGHTRYIEKDSPSKIGLLAHKYRGTTTNIPSWLITATGLTSGIAKSMANKGNGLMATGAGLTALRSAPTLTAEFLASKQGYEELKKNGATKEELKKYRKFLTTAFGTYALRTARDSGRLLLGRAAGVALGNMIKRRK